MKHFSRDRYEKNDIGVVREEVEKFPCTTASTRTRPSGLQTVKILPKLDTQRESATFTIPKNVLEWCEPVLRVSKSAAKNEWKFTWYVGKRSTRREILSIDSLIGEFLSPPHAVRNNKNNEKTLCWHLPLLRGTDDLVRRCDDEDMEVVFDRPLLANETVALYLLAKCAATDFDCVGKELCSPQATADRVYWSFATTKVDFLRKDDTLSFSLIGNCFLLYDPQRSLTKISLFDCFEHQFTVENGCMVLLERPWRTERNLIVEASGDDIHVRDGWYVLPVAPNILPQDAAFLCSTAREQTFDATRFNLQLDCEQNRCAFSPLVRVYWHHSNVLRFLDFCKTPQFN